MNSLIVVSKHYNQFNCFVFEEIDRNVGKSPKMSLAKKSTPKFIMEKINETNVENVKSDDDAKDRILVQSSNIKVTNPETVAAENEFVMASCDKIEHKVSNTALQAGNPLNQPSLNSNRLSSIVCENKSDSEKSNLDTISKLLSANDIEFRKEAIRFYLMEDNLLKINEDLEKNKMIMDNLEELFHIDEKVVNDSSDKLSNKDLTKGMAKLVERHKAYTLAREQAKKNELYNSVKPADSFTELVNATRIGGYGNKFAQQDSLPSQAINWKLWQLMIVIVFLVGAIKLSPRLLGI